MPEVKRRKIEFVKVGLTATGTFHHDFSLGFSPDDMIVRCWTCAGSTSVLMDNVALVNMEGVGDIFHFEPQQSLSPKNIFNLNKPIDGRVKFSIRDVDGNIANGTGSILVFTLEFVEFVR